ncbi:hypothetical protein YC2023_095872 [Brassica napus]
MVVSKKGVGVKVGKGQKRVDRRMKSDARQRGGGKPGRKGMKSATEVVVEVLSIIFNMVLKFGADLF